MYLHKHMWCQIKLSKTRDPIDNIFFNPSSARTDFRRLKSVSALEDLKYLLMGVDKYEFKWKRAN